MVGTVQAVDTEKVRYFGSGNREKIGVEEWEEVQRVEVNVLRTEGSRKDKLKVILKLGEDSLTTTQLERLGEFLLSADDVFFLDENDLGRTSLVRHKVDTVDHPSLLVISHSHRER